MEFTTILKRRRQYQLNFFISIHSPLHVSAPTGHPQVEHTLVILPGAIITTADPLFW
jgi:hypothetical protein